MFNLLFPREDFGSRWRKRGEDCLRRLQAREIAPSSAGTILKDFETLLEDIGSNPLNLERGNPQLSGARLAELNRKMSDAIEVRHKRPGLREYPNIAGLVMLLRVMRLLEIQGRQLVISGPALERWQQRNADEQYLSLLETFIFDADPTVLSTRRERVESWAPEELALSFLLQLSLNWRRFSMHESNWTFSDTSEIPPWRVFLLKQLGIIDIQQLIPEETDHREPGPHWYLGAAKLTPWGESVTWVLGSHLKADALAVEVEGDETLESVAMPDATPAENEPDDEEPEDEDYSPEMGVVLQWFQAWYPECQTAYVPSEPEPKRGTHLFKVTLLNSSKSVWRRLAVPPGMSLGQLGDAILESIKFDCDHPYEFKYRDTAGRQRTYSFSRFSETLDIGVGEADLAIGDEMEFIFDFGQRWEFCVQLEAVEDQPSRLKRTKLLESVGKAPRQYREW